MAKNPASGPRDTDVFERIGRINIAVWIVIGVLGALVFSPIFVFVPVVLPLIQLVAGRIARTVYDPTGSRVPSRPAYSGPESLAVRGRYEDAINAYEAAAREEPGDPEPWLRIARIERGDLKRPQRALEAFRTARARVAEGSPTALMIGREIADIYLTDLHEPTRAMPELARLAASSPDSPIGQWAARELADLKKTVDRRP